MFSDRFNELCKEKGVTANKACADMGLSRSLAAKWKSTKTQRPSAEVLEKMSIYFNLSIDEILGNVHHQKEKPANEDGLTERDKKDIAKNLERLMADLENSGDLMFDGDPASPEAIDSIRNAMAMALEYAKKVNKEKYTPKKYKK